MLSKVIKKFSDKYICKQQREEIDIILKSSPYYPSLLSILHTLQCVGIKAVVGKCDMAFLQKLKKPFLLHLKNHDYEKVLLASLHNHSGKIALYSSINNKWIEKEVSEVAKMWDGVIIYSEQAERPYYNIMTYFKCICVTIILIILFTLIYLFFHLKTCIIFLLIIAGVIVSIFSLIKGYGVKNNILDQICNASQHVNCHKISDSKYGKVFGFLMSELAISFFSAQFIVGLIILPYSNPPFEILESAMIVTFPILIYSASIQVFLKQICPLCMCILLVLITQTLWTFLANGIQLHVSILLIVFALTFVGAFINILIRTYINQKNKQKRDRYELLKLKRKYYILSNESIEFEGNIEASILWNKSNTSKYLITSFISPSCPNCKKQAREILELYDKNIVSFKWQIILGETHEEDKELNRNWISCYLNNSQSFFYQFKKWCYTDYFIELQGILSPKKQATAKEYLLNFNKKIKEYNLTRLPRYAINNQLLSSIYNGNDILYLLMDNETNQNNYRITKKET